MHYKNVLSTIFASAVVITQVFQPGIALASTTGYLYPYANGGWQNWSVNPSYEAHYVAVNDSGNCMNYDDYVYSSNSGLNYMESYKFSLDTVPNGTKINSIEAIPCGLSITTSSTLQMFLSYAFNGSTNNTWESVGGSTIIGTAKKEYATSTRTWFTWPYDSRPTKTSTSTLEVGFYKPDNDGYTVRVHQLRIRVNY